MGFLNRTRACAAPLCLLLLGLAQAGFADDLHFQASLEATAHPSGVDSNADGEPAYFGIWEGRSNLGPVKQEAWAEFLPWDGATFCGPTNVEVVYRFAENSIRFKDGSRIFTVLSSGTLCFDFANGTFDSTASVTIVGGSGRFAGASGTLAFHASAPFAFPNGLSVFTASYEGTITVP